ncbi:isochorismatase family protein [Sinomicrobium weinanense]|uniref:Isochorismatase family protein n=1 Tax=Sinomicrobium weinanense TaxID=2842200 RepID=A0A926Q4F1_9FLAO|nr:isochorismatase family protein [Sinomicrobium weinanense]MBC9797904.1 isochorismatase family protein [Sinomicrobium weinanense]MBU3125441.1 isochorismatase family protein [Sinomicrobium weinanense]
MKDGNALLIIDMQKGSFTSQTPRFDTEGVVMRINKLGSMFRELAFPVIFIQHDGTGTGQFEKNSTAWENLDELIVEPDDILVDKYANDIFYRTTLQSKLNELNVSDLFITGCATDFCVESAIQSALTKDYNITVVSNGHTTGERPHLKAEKVIEHYNWVWQNMIPTKGKIEVKSFEQIKNENTTYATRG